MATGIHTESVHRRRYCCFHCEQSWRPERTHTFMEAWTLIESYVDDVTHCPAKYELFHQPRAQRSRLWLVRRSFASDDLCVPDGQAPTRITLTSCISDSVLGTCRQLSIGPEAALSLIMGEAVARFIDSETHAHGHLSDAAKMTITMTVTSIITFQAGLITFLCVPELLASPALLTKVYTSKAWECFASGSSMLCSAE